MTRHGVFADRWLSARTAAALLAANALYWTRVAPIVRAQLRNWERYASEIPDSGLRELALANIAEEGFTAEAAALLATLAPSEHRRQAVEAIVALEVMFDYLDGVSELAARDQLGDDRALFAAFADSLSPFNATAELPSAPVRGDSRYLRELQATVRSRLGGLPGSAAAAGVWQRSAARTVEAQVRAHASASKGTSQAQAWAMSEADRTGLHWREFLAGAAASVVCVHALIVAAADPRTTTRDAEEIDALYLAMSALTTMLDTAIDYEQDMRTGQPWLVGQYDSPEALAEEVTRVAHRAGCLARRMPNGPQHLMTLVGIVAYYASHPGARSDFARPVTNRALRELRPVSGLAVAMMRAWRLAKRLREPGGRSGARRDDHG